MRGRLAYSYAFTQHHEKLGAPVSQTSETVTWFTQEAYDLVQAELTAFRQAYPRAP